MRWRNGWKTELKQYPKLALCGDYNIAPDDRDVHDPKRWKDCILVSEPERAAFQRLLKLGLTDSFRLFEQPEKTFSWWDYRMLGFQKNLGLRIDHILLSQPLAEKCTRKPASTAHRANASGLPTMPRSGQRRLKRKSFGRPRAGIPLRSTDEKLLKLYPALAGLAPDRLTGYSRRKPPCTCQPAPRSLPNTNPARDFHSCSMAVSRSSSKPAAAAN
jgi:hypothetical protein